MRRLAALLWLLSGCQLSYPYPEPEDERGIELCHDGYDQDLDGKIDCEDPDCSGSCAEVGAAFCDDGLDQDGDGRVDTDDPDCWSETAFEIDDCVSSANPARELPTFDRAQWTGSGRIEQVPNEAGGVDTVIAGQAGEYLVNAGTSAGEVSSMTLDVKFRLPEAGNVRFALVPTEDLVQGAPTPELHPEGLFVDIGLAPAPFNESFTLFAPFVALRYGGLDAPRDAFAGPLSSGVVAADRWMTLHLLVSQGIVQVTIDDSEPLPFLSTFGQVDTLRAIDPAIPTTWDRSRPLRFGWSTTSSEDVHIRRVTLGRGQFDPCLTAVPQLPGRTHGAALDDAGRLCVLHEAGVRGRIESQLYESVATAQLGGGFSTPFYEVIDGALTWSEADGGFVGAVLLARAGRPAEALLVRSPDCMSWTTGPSGLEVDLLEATTARGATYEVRATSEHVLRLPLSAVAALTASSPDGSEGSFAWVRGGYETRPRVLSTDVGPSVVEGHEVALVPELDGSLRLWVRRSATVWAPAKQPFVRPSQRLGSFDRSAIRGGLFVPIPDQRRGWLLHRGEAFEGSPTAIRDVTW